MKHFLTSSIVVLSLSLGGAMVASAQSAEPSQGQAPQAQGTDAPHHHGHKRSPEHETKMLTKKLGLSPDQAAQVEPILADRQTRMEALHENTSIDQQAKHEQMRAIMMDTKGKLDAVLNDQQKAQMQQMMEQRREKHQEHGAPAATPSL